MDKKVMLGLAAVGAYLLTRSPGGSAQGLGGRLSILPESLTFGPVIPTNQPPSYPGVGGAVVQTDQGRQFVPTKDLIPMLDLTNPIRDTSGLGTLPAGSLLPGLPYTDEQLRRAVASGNRVWGL